MRKFCFLILPALWCSIALYSQTPNPPNYQSLEPYDFHLQYLKHDSALLIDVRELFEFRGNRIKDAINIPSSWNLDFTADTLDKNFALFIYCTTDYRSRHVAEYFHDKGFLKVYNLDGGIVAWRKDGFPVIKNHIKKKI